MAKQKKKKKRRGFRLFVKIQLVLIVLVLAGLAFYFFGGYAKKISDLKSDAYDKVHSATDETFRSSQTSLVYDTNGNLISVLKGEKDMYYLEYEEIPSDVCSTNRLIWCRSIEIPSQSVKQCTLRRLIVIFEIYSRIIKRKFFAHIINIYVKHAKSFSIFINMKNVIG